eukprot:1389364-Rhodomonas_salina.1
MCSSSSSSSAPPPPPPCRSRQLRACWEEPAAAAATAMSRFLLARSLLFRSSPLGPCSVEFHLGCSTSSG